MSNLACPRCSAPLESVTVEGTEALVCPTHGMWISQERLDAIAEDDHDEHSGGAKDRAWSASDHDPAALWTERHRACPVCGTTLRKDVWKYGSGVVIDTCDEHGAWVDAGELERMDAWSEAWQRHAAAEG